MRSKLSGREKKMLYFLLIVVILSASIALLIMPSLSRLSGIEEELAEVSLQRTQMETEKSNLGDLNAQLEKLTGDGEARYKDFFSTETGSETIDRFITDIVLGAGLTPTSLSFSEVEYRGLTDYVGADSTQSSSSTSVDNNTAQKVMVLGVTVSTNGDYNQFTTLVKALGSKSQLEISIADFRAESNSIVISLDIYLIQPAEETSAAQ